jgi:hypothetical protein
MNGVGVWASGRNHRQVRHKLDEILQFGMMSKSAEQDLADWVKEQHSG